MQVMHTMYIMVAICMRILKIRFHKNYNMEQPVHSIDTITNYGALGRMGKKMMTNMVSYDT